jgi:glycosyltransferase involved in cell wall biosynthesis
MTAVHRVAAELIVAIDSTLLDSQAGEYPGARVELMVPRNADLSRLNLAAVRTRVVGALTGAAWEQFELPRHAGDRLVLNLCNLGPVLKRHAMTLIHDAQVYTAPTSSSRRFQIWHKAIFALVGRRHLKVLTVSEFSKSELVKFGIAPAERIEVVHNGIDHVLATPEEPKILKRLGLQPNSYCLALASTKPHKNIPMLLATFARPLPSDQRLVLFGPAGKADFERFGVAVPPGVIFAGKVSDPELRSLMQAALCLLCPSLTEGFGLPPLEAMLLGTPAVVSKIPVFAELCGDAAVQVDPLDPDGWVAAITRLATDPAFRLRMAERGHARASAFTWGRAARRLLELSAGASIDHPREKG